MNNQMADMLSGFLFGLGFGMIIGNYLLNKVEQKDIMNEDDWMSEFKLD